jgi:hypothetical protein
LGTTISSSNVGWQTSTVLDKRTLGTGTILGGGGAGDPASSSSDEGVSILKALCFCSTHNVPAVHRLPVF